MGKTVPANAADRTLPKVSSWHLNCLTTETFCPHKCRTNPQHCRRAGPSCLITTSHLGLCQGAQQIKRYMEILLLKKLVFKSTSTVNKANSFERGLVQAGVTHAPPAPVGGSSYNIQRSAFPSGGQGSSQGQQARRKEKGSLRLWCAAEICCARRCPPSPKQDPKLEREREEAAEGCLSSNHHVARAKPIRSGSLKWCNEHMQKQTHSTGNYPLFSFSSDQHSSVDC